MTEPKPFGPTGQDVEPAPARASRVHKLIATIQRGEIFRRGYRASQGKFDAVARQLCEDAMRDGTRFIIAHDWRKAFSEAGIDIKPTDEWRIPAPQALFEFSLIGTDAQDRFHAVMLIQDFRDERPGPKACGICTFVLGAHADAFILADEPALAPTLEEAVKKYLSVEGDGRGEIERMTAFVRAACIAIDMDAAESEEVIPPPKLNAARVRRGKPPMLSYRIINLTRRQRERAKAYAAGQGKPTRLHAVVGHWWPRKDNTESRFDEHRHWRKWRLRGDPDLGFIEHRYKI